MFASIKEVFFRSFLIGNRVAYSNKSKEEHRPKGNGLRGPLPKRLMKQSVKEAFLYPESHPFHVQEVIGVYIPEAVLLLGKIAAG